MLDLIMPLASGMDLLWSLRALDAGLTGRQSAIPHVIVLTALAEQDLPEDHVRAVARSQVKAVLRKPIDVKELSGLIRSHRQAHADR